VLLGPVMLLGPVVWARGWHVTADMRTIRIVMVRLRRRAMICVMMVRLRRRAMICVMMVSLVGMMAIVAPIVGHGCSTEKH
jgi:hypothetical protein